MAKKGDKPPKSNPNPTPVDPETQQKQRIRSLAVSKRILRRPRPFQVRPQARGPRRRQARPAQEPFSLLLPRPPRPRRRRPRRRARRSQHQETRPLPRLPQLEDEAIWHACVSEEQRLDAAADKIGQGGDVRGLLRELESSGNDSIASDAYEPKTEEPEREDEDDVRTDNGNASRRSILAELEDSMLATSSLLVDEMKIEQSSSSKKLKKAKENCPSKKGSLVQATLSSLFGKAAEKNSKRSTNDSPGPKGSGAKRQRVDSNHEQVQVKGSNKKEVSSGGKKSGTRTVSLKKQPKVVDDETDEIFSGSQDDSDEDWAA